MPLTFVAAGALAVNETVVTQNIVGPACQADDILIAALLNKSLTVNAISAPAGWTQIVQDVTDTSHTEAEHEFAVFWKRATAGDSSATFQFTKATDDNVVFGGVIAAWRGAVATGDPLDATPPGVDKKLVNAENVEFAAFDPTESDVRVIYVAFYGQDVTNFTTTPPAGSNPTMTVHVDEETGIGTDFSIAICSGDNDGANVAARLWASASAVDVGSTGVVFALRAPPSGFIGDAAITVPVHTASAEGAVALQGAASVTLAIHASTATGTVLVLGAAAVVLLAHTASATGVGEFRADASITLPAHSVVANGVMLVQGAATLTLPAHTASSAGTVGVAGSATITLQPHSTSALGSVLIQGSASVTLASHVATGVGSAPSVSLRFISQRLSAPRYASTRLATPRYAAIRLSSPRYTSTRTT